MKNAGMPAFFFRLAARSSKRSATHFVVCNALRRRPEHSGGVFAEILSFGLSSSPKHGIRQLIRQIQIIGRDIR
ncbi:hypothetical protein [Burkholderia sp. RF2-non_BP3]|uniref:hypothetical protein n=1 Tax=Burkholderia sp. RF2-non_BP3 TaxID=1637844 RepID=UPI0012E3BE28|nr:hypothetical protein [Burkholderia sp. RF2-non_BP3]